MVLAALRSNPKMLSALSMRIKRSRLLILAVLAAASACKSKEPQTVVEVPKPVAYNRDGSVPESDGILEGFQREVAAARTFDAQTAARVQPVHPIVDCVEPLSATEWRAHFGYANDASDTIEIPVSVFNRVWPPPLARGQPTRFGEGTRKDVLGVKFNPLGSTAWVLGTAFAVATPKSPRCSKK
jgi:hypothetical protein